MAPQRGKGDFLWPRVSLHLFIRHPSSLGIGGRSLCAGWAFRRRAHTEGRGARRNEHPLPLFSDGFSLQDSYPPPLRAFLRPPPPPLDSSKSPSHSIAARKLVPQERMLTLDFFKNTPGVRGVAFVREAPPVDAPRTPLFVVWKWLVVIGVGSRFYHAISPSASFPESFPPSRRGFQAPV